VALLVLASGGRPAAAETTTTTEAPTTTVAPTTTTVPVTTTTVPATTTTTRPATTTTSHPTTTTTTHPATTTTTTAPVTPTSSSTPWGLILLIVAILAAIVLVVLLLRSRNKGAAIDTWRRRALPALTDARLAREALLSPSATADDPELRGAIQVQADKAAGALEQAGQSAPEPGPGGAATTAAGALRGLAFAVEADRLLRNGASAPTGVQLAQADEARRARDAELQAALARLQAEVAPPAG
jgi:hypothetical protein